MFRRIQALIVFALIFAGPARADVLSWFTGHGGMRAEYAAPNEHYNYYQYNIAKLGTFDQPTAAVAVGTLRAFNLAGVLRRDMLVAVDISQGIVTINEAIAHMIVQKNRQEFISSLLLFEETQARIDTAEQFRALATLALDNHDGNREFRRILRRTGNETAKWITEIRKYGTDAETFGGTFFSNDEAYEHVRSLIRNGKFHTRTADLGNYESVFELGEFVRERGHVVSEFDISNVMDYVANLTRSQKLVSFVASVDALPHDRDSRVLLTVFKEFATGYDSLKLPKGDQWVYLAPTFHDFITNGSQRKSAIYGHLFDLHGKSNGCAARIAH